jgi:hypothetical protein
MNMESMRSQLMQPGIVRDGAFLIAVLTGLMALHFINVSFSVSSK